jgi:hypothetical protein
MKVGSQGGIGVWRRDVLVECGVHPVKIADRFGLHCGEATKQWSNFMPRAARRSRLGVLIAGFPKQPRSS